MRITLFGAAIAAFLAAMPTKPAQAMALPAPGALNTAADALSVTEKVTYGWGYYRPWRPYYRPHYGYYRPWRPYYRPYYSHYRPWRPYFFGPGVYWGGPRWGWGGPRWRAYHRPWGWGPRWGWGGPRWGWGGPRFYRASFGPRYWGGYRPHWGWRGGYRGYRRW